jgi:hypothetical protein
MLNMPGLRVEWAGGPDDEICLEQEFGGQAHLVSIHPAQLLLIAERIGAKRASTEALTIARQARQLRLLRERITELDRWLHAVDQAGHEDLTAELVFSFATKEIADAFVADLDDCESEEPSKRLRADGSSSGNGMANAMATPHNDRIADGHVSASKADRNVLVTGAPSTPTNAPAVQASLLDPTHVRTEDAAGKAPHAH